MNKTSENFWSSLPRTERLLFLKIYHPRILISHVRNIATKRFTEKLTYFICYCRRYCCCLVLCHISSHYCFTFSPSASSSLTFFAFITRRQSFARLRDFWHLWASASHPTLCSLSTILLQRSTSRQNKIVELLPKKTPWNFYPH